MLRIASDLALSKEAAARRYVELHPVTVAAAFTENGIIRYAVVSKSCPRLSLTKGTGLLAPSSVGPGHTTQHEIEIELPHSNGQPRSISALAETLYQKSGFAITLLTFEADIGDEDGDDPVIEDTFDRFSRY